MTKQRPGNKNLRPPFPPGVSGNPSGRPKSLITKDQVKALMGRFWDLNSEELLALVKSPTATMGEKMIAAVMVEAAKTGDNSRLSFLLDRMIGRVKDELEVSQVKPYVIQRLDGSQTLLGAEKIEAQPEDMMDSGIQRADLGLDISIQPKEGTDWKDP